MTKPYDSDSILVLKKLEPIQKNPSMFIGNTQTCQHLLTEAYDNSLDEASGGFATLVGVVIDTKNKIYEVADNGRGIPIENNSIEIVASELFSGGKFSKGEKDNYSICTGLHGVGICAITALSEFMEIQVYRDNKHATYKWKNSILESKEIVDCKEKDVPFSTYIKFKPNKKYFGTPMIDVDYIRKRMKLASVHIPKLKLLLQIDNNKEIISCDINNYFKDDILGNKEHHTPIKTINVLSGKESLKIMWCYSLDGSPTPKHHGSINILSVDSGSHINETGKMFTKVFMDFAKKKKMNIIKQDCLVGFRAITNIMKFETAFTSQDKKCFDMRRDQLEYLYSPAEKELVSQLEKDEDTLNVLLMTFENYRKKLDSSKMVVKTEGSVTRANCFLDTKLRDCITHSVKDSELYIVEGESAGGTLVAARNPQIHAILPLKGKAIPNIIAAGKKDILCKGKNKEKKSELVELINALGTGIEPHFNIEGIRYGKVIICPDADSDGKHIFTMLAPCILKLMPEIIRRGYLYMAQMPLYGIRKKDSFIPIYTDEDLNKIRAKGGGEEIVRFKGLGEMNAEQLGICLLDPKHRRLIQIPYPENEEYLYNLLIDPALKRKIV